MHFDFHNDNHFGLVNLGCIKMLLRCCLRDFFYYYGGYAFKQRV